MQYQKIFFPIAASAMLFCSCTKLNEDFQGDLRPDQVGGGGSSVDALLKGAYNSMRNSYQGQERMFAMTEMTTDELIAPTRGPDWDDNGVWRVLHAHRWDGDNIHIRDAFNDLSGTVFAATDLLQYNPNPEQAAEARFLRAFSMFNQLDGWNQVPFRDPGESVLTASRIMLGADALNYIVTELNEILPDLPDGTVSKANKDAARVLLMKCYLNKGVFSPSAGDPLINRETPTFDNADMAKVIELADDIINTNRYSLNSSYFDNFAPNNGDISTENIFTALNIGGSDAGAVNSRWHLTMHYNQTPSGWNGFTTLSDFYDKFETTDQRRGLAYPDGTANPGNRVNVGFMVGQQYNLATDQPLQDRSGSAPLAFTREVKSIETGTNLEVTGIRVNKYPIDYTNDGSGQANNDYVYYRYSDVLLMKAEAMLRSGGSASEALSLVNQIRSIRGASAFTTLTLDNLLDERGRELYWEMFRRQDLIRFGKFMEPWQEKTGADDRKYLLLTIPNQQLAVNPNLVQNPGY